MRPTEAETAIRSGAAGPACLSAIPHQTNADIPLVVAPGRRLLAP
ncbi:MAG: hypothetical protein ABSE20_07400 [Acetobacteraceae bacterium]|jgi:hypothetical protein